jgi:uncharacterized protein (TIGR03067 family)
MLRGAWRIVTEINSGEANPDAGDNGYWFLGDRLIIGSQDAAWEWRIRIDPNVTPHTIDMWADGRDEAFQDRGIWELDGDRLRLCWGCTEQRGAANRVRQHGRQRLATPGVEAFGRARANVVTAAPAGAAS